MGVKEGFWEAPPTAAVNAGRGVVEKEAELKGVERERALEE